MERLAEACRQAGREPEEVALVGACKRQPLERIAAALDAGLRILGENQVQEGEVHRAALVDAGYGDRVAWHLIGPLQSNKAARACDAFDVFEAVDRPKIAERLDRVLGSRGLGARGCLLEVNIGSEPSKHGFLPEDREAMLRIGELDHLRVRGLMAIPPQRSDARESRADFAALRRLRDRLAQGGLFGDREGWLSMGMSAESRVAWTR